MVMMTVLYWGRGRGGGVLGISSAGDDRTNGTKSQDPKKTLGFPAKPKISLDQNVTPKKSMPILWPLKAPERGK